MDFNLTMRYHGLVFSMETATPFAGLSYDMYSHSKMKGIYDFFKPGLEETHIHITMPAEQDRLNRKVAYLFENRKTLFENMSNFLEKDNNQYPRKTMLLRKLIHDNRQDNSNSFMIEKAATSTYGILFCLVTLKGWIFFV